VVAKLADMVKEVDQEMHCHNVEIQFVNKMMCNFCHYLCLICINALTLSSHRMNVPSGVTILFLLIIQYIHFFQVLQHLLCRFAGV